MEILQWSHQLLPDPEAPFTIGFAEEKQRPRTILGDVEVMPLIGSGIPERSSPYLFPSLGGNISIVPLEDNANEIGRVIMEKSFIVGPDPMMKTDREPKEKKGPTIQVWALGLPQRFLPTNLEEPKRFWLVAACVRLFVTLDDHNQNPSAEQERVRCNPAKRALRETRCSLTSRRHFCSHVKASFDEDLYALAQFPEQDSNTATFGLSDNAPGYLSPIPSGMFSHQITDACNHQLSFAKTRQYMRSQPMLCQLSYPGSMDTLRSRPH